jgi:hypothetical protein
MFPQVITLPGQSHPAVSAAAVAASSSVFVVSGQVYQLGCLALGLLGVWLARTVFVDQENRKLRRRQKLRETMPLTLAGMLVVGSFLWDANTTLAKASLFGLSVGYGTMLILKMLGRMAPGLARAIAGGLIEFAEPAIESDRPKDEKPGGQDDGKEPTDPDAVAVAPGIMQRAFGKPPPSDDARMNRSLRRLDGDTDDRL